MRFLTLKPLCSGHVAVMQLSYAILCYTSAIKSGTKDPVGGPPAGYQLSLSPLPSREALIVAAFDSNRVVTCGSMLSAATFALFGSPSPESTWTGIKPVVLLTGPSAVPQSVTKLSPCSACIVVYRADEPPFTAEVINHYLLALLTPMPVAIIHSELDVCDIAAWLGSKAVDSVKWGIASLLADRITLADNAALMARIGSKLPFAGCSRFQRPRLEAQSAIGAPPVPSVAPDHQPGAHATSPTVGSSSFHDPSVGSMPAGTALRHLGVLGVSGSRARGVACGSAASVVPASKWGRTVFDFGCKLVPLLVSIVARSLAPIAAVVTRCEPPLSGEQLPYVTSLRSYRWALAALLVLPAHVCSLTAITDANIDAAVTAWITSPTTATLTYGNIGDWNTAAVTSMANAFDGKTTFNDDIGSWNVASVTRMDLAFKDTRAFNQNISLWNTASATTMTQMFCNADEFVADISRWNTARVANMRLVFYGLPIFNVQVCPMMWPRSVVSWVSPVSNAGG
jgi:hypothetical protein